MRAFKFDVSPCLVKESVLRIDHSQNRLKHGGTSAEQTGGGAVLPLRLLLISAADPSMRIQTTSLRSQHLA